MSQTSQPTLCPTCEQAQVRRVREDWTGQFQGKVYTVQGLEFHVCPHCGEKIYSPTAMRRIEAASPAFPAPARGRQPLRQLKPATAGADT
jgi:YgiT-type zinc finger domain-containing protein